MMRQSNVGFHVKDHIKLCMQVIMWHHPILCMCILRVCYSEASLSTYLLKKEEVQINFTKYSSCMTHGFLK